MNRASILLPRPSPLPGAERRSKLAAKLGVGAFLFFLIKGLAWLVVPFVVALIW